MTSSGRKSRKDRLLTEGGSPGGSSSQDFNRLARQLFAASEDHTRALNDNSSVYALAGIPVLFSALRCLLIELYSDLFWGTQGAPARLKTLAEAESDCGYLKTHYTLGSRLAEDLELLWEVRNEIAHPSHISVGGHAGTPEYLLTLKARGLLQSTGKPDDYIWIEQLQSHRLFAWALQTISATIDVLIREENVPEYFAGALRGSYAVGPQPDWNPAPDRIGLDSATLGEVFATAENSLSDFPRRFPEIYRLLERIHGAYAKLQESIEHDNQHQRVVPRMLIVRTHAAVIAALRTGMGGQLFEAYPLLRAAIENAWYALHMAKDPEGTKRAEIWLRRDESKKAEERCRAEFTIARVRATHEGLDATSAQTVHDLYKHMIAFGAHPNQLGVLSGLGRTDVARQTTFLVPLLTVEELPMLLAVRMAAAVAVGGLHVARLIYPERVRITGLDRETDALGGLVDSVFRPYVTLTGEGNQDEDARRKER